MDPRDEDEEEEERQLRAVALENAKSILLARQRAEEQLVRAKEALELKTEELAHSLAMMRATLESTTDGILVTDGAGTITGFNQKFVEMWRIPSAALDSGEHRRLVAVNSREFAEPPQFLARIEAIYASSPPESYDLLELADGRFFERFSRIQFVEQRNVGRVWSFRDITIHMRAEKDLRKQSEWLRVTLASIGDAVITTDAAGRVSSLNPVAESLTGWSAREAEGRPLAEVFRIVNEESRAPAENPAARALSEGRIVGLANHTVLVARDGSERAIDDSAAPIRDDIGNVIGVVLIFRDISERRRDEEKLRQSIETTRSLLAALEESDRRKDEFLAMLAHELRNPLAPIRNAVQILRAKAPPVPQLEWATEVIARQVQQMTRLVDDLLDVSRIAGGKLQLHKERIDLAAVVNSAVEASRPLIEKGGHEFTVVLPSPPIHVDADLTRLSQVLLNLLNNAAKYTDRGGRIGLTVEPAGDRVLVRVEDTGIGIPPEMLPRVFDMFTQVDRSLERSEGGLGIGLTLVQRLVELHGGTAEAHSEGTGKGSEFIVRLPLAVEDGRAIPAPAPGGEHLTAGSSRRILVVDDNRDSAESLVMLLAMAGNEVRTAHDGLEAVEAAAAFQPDVVLLDIGLPKLNGYDAARRIRQQRGDGVVLIAVTGWGQEEDRRLSREAGFDHHLTKPVNLGALQKLLTAARSSRRV